MPRMSSYEAAFCRSTPWRAFARRVVLPWALQGFEPHGDVLEIGAGSGAMAAELLRGHPNVRMTVTDFDEAMVEMAQLELTPFGDRVTVRQADATALPFPDGSFDCVVSWIMLHHTIEFEKAIAEAVRVLRPGGQLVGYDLLSTALMRRVHQAEGSKFRMMHFRELRDLTGELPVDQAILTPSLAGATVRFLMRKAPSST